MLLNLGVGIRYDGVKKYALEKTTVPSYVFMTSPERTIPDIIPMHTLRRKTTIIRVVMKSEYLSTSNMRLETRKGVVSLQISLSELIQVETQDAMKASRGSDLA